MVIGLIFEILCAHRLFLIFNQGVTLLKQGSTLKKLKGAARDCFFYLGWSPLGISTNPPIEDTVAPLDKLAQYPNMLMWIGKKGRHRGTNIRGNIRSMGGTSSNNRRYKYQGYEVLNF